MGQRAQARLLGKLELAGSISASSDARAQLELGKLEPGSSILLDILGLYIYIFNTPP